MTSPPASQPQRSRRRWYQFSLRSVLVFVTLIVLGLVAWALYVEPYRHERQVMPLIEELGGRYESETRGPVWLAKVFGSDRFQAVTFVNLADCDEPQRYLPAISRCPWLEVLVIGGNEVGDEEVLGLRRLKGLRGLVLDSTAASDDAVRELQEALPDLTVHKSQRRAIAGFKEMRDASVTTRAIARPAVFRTSVGDEHFEVAIDIFVLDFSRSELTDSKLALVRWLVDLEGFGISAGGAAKFTDVGLRNLAAIPKLQRFVIRSERITDRGLARLKGKTTLEMIHLWPAALTDDGLAQLPLKGLKGLMLSGTKVTDAGLVNLKQCAYLRSLDLTDTAVSDDGLAVLAALDSLEVLNLRGSQVTDAGLTHIVKLRRLHWLDVSNTRITGKVIPELSALPELRHFAISPAGIDAQWLKRLRDVPKLESLGLGEYGGRSPIDDAAAAEIARLKRLRELHLDGSKITDAGLALLERELPDLQTLTLGGTDVTTEAANTLRKARPKLNLQHYPARTPSGKGQ